MSLLCIHILTSILSPDCRPADTEDGVEPHLTAHRALLAAHQASLEAGRASSSRAVRRAERHAAASGRDPRHEVTARPRTEVTALAVAARLAPPQGRHLATQLAARSRGGARVRRLVRELEAVTRAAVMAGGGSRGGGAEVGTSCEGQQAQEAVATLGDI